HVVGQRHRPEPLLLGEFFEALRPVDRTALAHLLESLVRRTVQPQLALGEFEALDIPPDRCHQKPPLSSGMTLAMIPGQLASCVRFIDVRSRRPAPRPAGRTSPGRPSQRRDQWPWVTCEVSFTPPAPEPSFAARTLKRSVPLVRPVSFT